MSIDITYNVLYDIVDMTDFTTIIDTTEMDVTFSLINGSITDVTNYSYLSKLNKYFHLGPRGSDTTITSLSFTKTGLPIISFNDKLKFQIFIMKYQPQFVVMNNTNNNSTLIVGQFYYNNDTNTIECYFTDEEKDDFIGLTFNNIYLFYSDI